MLQKKESQAEQPPEDKKSEEAKKEETAKAKEETTSDEGMPSPASNEAQTAEKEGDTEAKKE